MTQKFIDNYTALCRELSLPDETSKESIQKNNKAAKALSKLFLEIGKDRHTAEMTFDVLMDNPNERVKVTAASHSLKLGLNIQKAVSTLEQVIYHSESPYSRFEANMVLKIWLKEM